MRLPPNKRSKLSAPVRNGDGAAPNRGVVEFRL